MKHLLAIALLLTLVQTVRASEGHVDLIARTPCLEAYRLWFFSTGRSTSFPVPADFTKEQCDRAAELHETIQAELAVEQQERAERVAREVVAQEAKERAAKHAELVAIADALAARLKMPSPRIGMTAQQVRDASNWGPPREVNRTTTGSGVTEQWVYGLKRYLYFRNGRLEAIQD